MPDAEGAVLKRIPHIMVLVLALLAVAWAQDAAPGPRPVPLSELMLPDWAARAPWNDGLSEIAEYEVRIPRDGSVAEGRTVLVTGQEDFSRESLARAAWPYGSRPVTEAMRQRSLTTPGRGDGATALIDLWVDRRATLRPLRLTATQVAAEGALMRDFDFTGVLPAERYASPRDDEGTGTRSVDSPQEAVFEEQLPLVLRGLRYADGAQAWLTLMEPVSDGRAVRPTSALAMLTMAREAAPPRLPMRGWQGEPPWRVTIEAGDGRRIECLVAAEPARTLLSIEHSGGGGMALSALRRGVFDK